MQLNSPSNKQDVPRDNIDVKTPANREQLGQRQALSTPRNRTRPPKADGSTSTTRSSMDSIPRAPLKHSTQKKATIRRQMKGLSLDFDNSVQNGWVDDSCLDGVRSGHLESPEPSLNFTSNELKLNSGRDRNGTKCPSAVANSVHIPFIYGSNVSMPSPDPCSKFHEGPGPVNINEDDTSRQEIKRISSKECNIPLIYGSNVTMPSPDPCSKYHEGVGPVHLREVHVCDESTSKPFIIPLIHGSNVTMASSDPLSKFHDGSGPQFESPRAAPNTPSHTHESCGIAWTPELNISAVNRVILQNKIGMPLIYGSNVTMESPDPFSKYHEPGSRGLKSCPEMCNLFGDGKETGYGFVPPLIADALSKTKLVQTSSLSTKEGKAESIVAAARLDTQNMISPTSVADFGSSISPFKETYDLVTNEIKAAGAASSGRLRHTKELPVSTVISLARQQQAAAELETENYVNADHSATADRAGISYKSSGREQTKPQTTFISGIHRDLKEPFQVLPIGSYDADSAVVPATSSAVSPHIALAAPTPDSTKPKILRPMPPSDSKRPLRPTPPSSGPRSMAATLSQSSTPASSSTVSPLTSSGSGANGCVVEGPGGRRQFVRKYVKLSPAKSTSALGTLAGEGDDSDSQRTLRGSSSASELFGGGRGGSGAEMAAAGIHVQTLSPVVEEQRPYTAPSPSLMSAMGRSSPPAEEQRDSEAVGVARGQSFRRGRIYTQSTSLSPAALTNSPDPPTSLDSLPVNRRIAGDFEHKDDDDATATMSTPPHTGIPRSFDNGRICDIEAGGREAVRTMSPGSKGSCRYSDEQFCEDLLIDDDEEEEVVRVATPLRMTFSHSMSHGMTACLDDSLDARWGHDRGDGGGCELDRDFRSSGGCLSMRGEANGSLSMNAAGGIAFASPSVTTLENWLQSEEEAMLEVVEPTTSNEFDNDDSGNPFAAFDALDKFKAASAASSSNRLGVTTVKVGKAAGLEFQRMNGYQPSETGRLLGGRMPRCSLLPLPRPLQARRKKKSGRNKYQPLLLDSIPEGKFLLVGVPRWLTIFPEGSFHRVTRDDRYGRCEPAPVHAESREGGSAVSESNAHTQLRTSRNDNISTQKEMYQGPDDAHTLLRMQRLIQNVDSSLGSFPQQSHSTYRDGPSDGSEDASKENEHPNLQHLRAEGSSLPAALKVPPIGEVKKNRLAPIQLSTLATSTGVHSRRLPLKADNDGTQSFAAHEAATSRCLDDIDTYGLWMTNQMYAVAIGSTCEEDIFSSTLLGDLETLKQRVNDRDGDAWSVYSRDRAGNTPLMVAATTGLAKVIKLFIKCGADLDSQNQFGNTALHFAQESGQGRACAYLLRKGANDQLVNSMGLRYSQRKTD